MEELMQWQRSKDRALAFAMAYGPALDRCRQDPQYRLAEYRLHTHYYLATMDEMLAAEAAEAKGEFLF